MNRSYEDVVTEALYSKKDPTKLDYTIVARENGKPVGRIYITRIDRNFDSLDITRFYIGESSLWGNGLGREIMHELLEYCFTFLHMERWIIMPATDAARLCMSALALKMKEQQEMQRRRTASIMICT